MRTQTGLLQLQRAAGNRAVQRWVGTGSADFTEVTDTAQYRLNASIPVARDAADDPGSGDPGAGNPAAAQDNAAQDNAAQDNAAQDNAAQDNAAQDDAAVPDGVPDAVSIGPEDATQDVEPMMAEADKVAGQLGYTTSVSQEQGDPTDPTEFGFTWGYHIKVANGGKIHYDKPSSTWQVSVTYDNPVKFRVYTSAGPRGQADIESPNDAQISKGNFPQVAADLTPGADGRPPRNHFWSRDLTISHEQFHVVDGQGLCRQAVTSEQAQLNQQQANSMDDVKALLNPIPGRIIKAREAGMKNGGEDRAYAAGKAAYQTRADTIRANGKANKYAMADGGELGNAVASSDTTESGEATADQAETAPA